MAKPKRKTLPPGQYGDLSGYSPVELTKKKLGECRVGLTPANPAGVVAFVRRIDELEKRIAELEST